MPRSDPGHLNHGAPTWHQGQTLQDGLQTWYAFCPCLPREQISWCLEPIFFFPLGKVGNTREIISVWITKDIKKRNPIVLPDTPFPKVSGERSSRMPNEPPRKGQGLDPQLERHACGLTLQSPQQSVTLSKRELLWKVYRYNCLWGNCCCFACHMLYSLRMFMLNDCRSGDFSARVWA